MLVKPTLSTVANVATLLACIVVTALAAPSLAERWRGPKTTSPVEEIGDIPARMPPIVKGKRNAPIALIEFSDFQCPFCGRYARETYFDIQKEFVDTNLVLYGFRNAPLAQLHARAVAAATAAVCAGSQSSFWPMHDLLFAEPSNLEVDAIRTNATRLGLDLNRFETCTSSSPLALAEDGEEVKRLKVTSTPTFMIGRLQSDGSVILTAQIRGAQSIDVFRNAIRTQISQTR